MKLLTFPTALVLAVAGCFALPLDSQARDDHHVVVYQDRDHDGHYNRKTIDVHGHYYGGNHYYGNRYYGGRYYGGYGYPYRGYGYGYGPSVGITYYSAPVYRSYDYGGVADDDVAYDVQRELRRRGYYHGPIDGDIGPGTRSSIRAYQYDRRLPLSGRVDGPLLRSLGV